MLRKVITTGRITVFFCLGALLILAGCNNSSQPDPTAVPDGQAGEQSGQSSTGGSEGTDNSGGIVSSSGDNDSSGSSGQNAGGAAPLEFTSTDDGLVASASGERANSAPNRYRFDGQAGQKLIVIMQSEPNVGFNLFQNDVPIDIDRSDAGMREWTIPADGAYEIWLFNGSAGSPFSFEATLSGQLIADIVTPGVPPPPTEPEIIEETIQFEAGADNTTVEKTFDRYAIHRYRIGVAEGQYLVAMVTSAQIAPSNLYKPNTNIRYESEEGEATLDAGPLPEGGEYILEIGPGNQGNSYSLWLVIQNQPIVLGSPSLGVDGANGSAIVWLEPWGTTEVIFNGSATNGDFRTVDSFDLYAPGATAGNPTQKIDFQTEGDIILSDLTFVAEDVNFDGFTDLRLAKFTPAGSNIPSAYWLWDNGLGQFVRNEAFDVLMHPQVLPNNRIMTFSRLGLAYSDQMLYEITADGPLLINWQSCEFIEQDDGSVIIENILYSVDPAGNRTVVMEATSQNDCLPFGGDGVEGEGGVPTLDEMVTLNPWGELTAALRVEPSDNDRIWVNSIDLIEDGTTRQSLSVDPLGLVPYNEGTLIAEDINLDGFTDLRLLSNFPAGPNITYFYWLYDSATDSFVRARAYDSLSAPEFVGDGNINTFSRDSAAEYTFSRYQVTPDGPKLVGRQDCVFTTKEDGTGVVLNTGYSFDDAGNEILGFEEESQSDCLPYKATP